MLGFTCLHAWTDDYHGAVCSLSCKINQYQEVAPGTTRYEKNLKDKYLRQASLNVRRSMTDVSATPNIKNVSILKVKQQRDDNAWSIFIWVYFVMCLF